MQMQLDQRYEQNQRCHEIKEHQVKTGRVLRCENQCMILKYGGTYILLSASYLLQLSPD